MFGFNRDSHTKSNSLKAFEVYIENVQVQTSKQIV